jgi:hypothetical protein
MKKLKIYRVINDTHKSHGQVNNYAKLHEEAGNDHLWLKETKTGVCFLCHKSDVVDATAEYITKKIEKGTIFLTGLMALFVSAANIIKCGHWLASLVFAIIGVACFAIVKLQKDEY